MATDTTTTPSKSPSPVKSRGSPTTLSISPKRASSVCASPCSLNGDDGTGDDEDQTFAGIVSKRRKMTHNSDSDDSSADDSFSGGGRKSLRSSPVCLFRGSPLSSFGEPRASPVSLFRELREAELQAGLKGGATGDQQHLRPPSVASSSFSSSVGGVDSSMNSAQSSRMGSPSGDRKYQKHELWASIQSDYHYLMDEEIIETCKSTESDLSWESDELCGSSGGKFSLSEFVQQYNELTEWLNAVQAGTQHRTGATLSEKYLNQSYYEELLRQSPRRRLLGEYARQLVRRYPALRDEISVRQARINALWAAVEAAVALPDAGLADTNTVITDLEQDMGELRRWLHSVEERLPKPPTIDLAWDKPELRRRLQEHKVIQSEIESHSQLVTAVLKLCERLEHNSYSPAAAETSTPNASSSVASVESLTLVARSLERRWHTVWLSSLEWQFRLEEALACTKPSRPDNSDGCWDIPLRSSFASTQTEPLSPYSSRRPRPDPDTYADLDSDTSCNYDVLPFSENEYEKLTDGGGETGLTEDDDDQEVIYAHYPPVDSALGRSVSDENNLGKSGRELLLKAKEEAEEEEKRKEQQEEEEKKKSMRASAIHSMCPPKHGDSHDVGYSSESHSNEEAEGFTNPLHASSPKLNTRIDLKLESDDTIPKMRNKNTLDVVDQKAEWRQSMTSAYDTSSNCSDLAHAHDLDVPLDTSVDTIQENGESDLNVSALTATPNHSFYCMTTIESMTDTEPSSSADKVDVTGNRSGATTDAECDLSRSLDGAQIEDLPYDYSLQASTIPEETVTSSTGGSRSDVAGTDKERAMSMSISGGSSHDLEHAADSPTRMRPNKNDITELTTALNRYLAKQTTATKTEHPLDNKRDLTLSEEDLKNGNATKTGQSAEKRPPTANDSFTSTDGSVRQTDDGCDASSEGTGSESESDFSTASSDNEHDPLDASVLTAIHSKGNSTLCQGSRSLGSSPLKSSSAFQRATKRKGDRPHSIADLYSLHLSGPHTSNSEGAIDNLRAYSLHEDNLKLRRTVSDLTSIRRDSPRKHKRRRIRRTKSDEASKGPYSTSGRKSGRSSPIPIGTTSPAHKHLPRPKPSHSTPTNRTLQSPYRHPGQQVTSESDIEIPRRSRPSGSVRRQLLSPECDSCCDNPTQLNSTVDSFSEQAWDNYQVPPYSSVSEDPNEEKLDASRIIGEWEHNLDFEEDFHLDSRFGSGYRGQPKAGGTAFPPAQSSVADDSDSDLEDFNDVIEESCKALQFTEQALQKNRKDPLDMGIFLDPAEYSDAQATCRTNIKCLEEVHSTLIAAATSATTTTAKDPSPSSPSSCPPSPTLLDEGLARVEELIARWKVVQGVAGQRREQATSAGGIWRAACQAKRTLMTAAETLGRLRQQGRYHYAGQLEEALAELQQVKSLLHGEEGLLQESQELIDSLQLEHPSLHTASCEQEIRALTSDLRDLLEQTTVTSSDLQGKLRSWYELDEIQRELEYMLKQERREFACLELARALAQSQEEIAYSLHDLELLDIALGSYEASVEHARGLYAGDVAGLCTPRAHAALAAQLASLHAQTSQLRAHTAHLAPLLQHAHQHAPMARTRLAHKELVNATVWQKLRRTLPLPVAMTIVFGAVYLLDGDGIVFTPQLHYVRGPPPT